MLYHCKGSNLVVAVHDDNQIYVDPVTAYGLGTYLVADYNGPAPKTDPNTNAFLFPTITPAIQAASVKLECRRRITVKVSEQAQRNITSMVSDVQSIQLAGNTPTAGQLADVDTATQIWAWIGRPNGMQATCDAMIAANDLEWYLDVKWPPWNSAWDAFVARF